MTGFRSSHSRLTRLPWPGSTGCSPRPSGGGRPARPNPAFHPTRGGARVEMAPFPRAARVEWGEAVREPRHGAADADAPRVHAAAQVVDGPARGDVAVDHGTPAADLHEALLVAEAAGEHPLLVVACADAIAVDG